MMRRLLRSGVVAAVALALVAGACSGDDGDAGDDADASTTTTVAEADADAREEFIAALAEEVNSPEFPLEPAEAECFATAVVDTVGTERLEELGLTPEELAEGDIVGDAADAFEEVREEMTDELAACELSTVFAGLFVDQLGVSEDAIECVIDSIDDREFAGLLIGAALGEEDEASGEAYGKALIGGLDGPCAKGLVLELFEQQGILAELDRACVEENLEEELARRLLDPVEQEERPEELQADLEAVMLACA